MRKNELTTEKLRLLWEGRLIAGTVREKLINYLDEKGMSVYRFAKDSGIPQSTIWSIIKKEDYEVREKNIHKICAGMGISVSEVMDPEGQQKINLSKDEIPVVIKYRKLGERDQGRVQGYVDALIEINQDNL